MQARTLGLLVIASLLATDAGAQGVSEVPSLEQRFREQLGAQGPMADAVARRAAQLASNPKSSLVYVVHGSDGRRNREVTGPVADSVQGVPAQPVDSGVFDGIGHEKLSYSWIWMVLDPANDEGTVWARWYDQYGFWSVTQTVHAPPPHPTALRIAPDATMTELVTDAVQTHGYQHGNTGAGGAVMPTVFQHLACFGPTRVTLNGKPFLNPYSGPTAPDWFGAFKVSDGVRDAVDGTVRNTSGGIFSPMNPGDGRTDPDDLEIQCIFHDDQLPPPGNMANFPPRHRFFYWIDFEDVTVQILQSN